MYRRAFLAVQYQTDDGVQVMTSGCADVPWPPEMSDLDAVAVRMVSESAANKGFGVLGLCITSLTWISDVRET